MLFFLTNSVLNLKNIIIYRLSFIKEILKKKKKKISKEAPKKPEIKKKVKIKDIEVVGIKKKEQLSLLP